MMLKRLFFKLLALLLLMVSLPAFSQTETTRSEYDLNVERAKEKWLKVIPNIGTIQYAGNIGAISAGIGWDYGKHDRWETHIQAGFVPKMKSERAAMTFTLRENLVPWSFGLGRRSWAEKCNDRQWNRRAICSLEPAVFSFFMNTIFNDEFWVREPEKYNGGDYYNFSSKVRTHIAISSRLSLNIPRDRQKHFERISVYYEISTYDLAIISAIPNKTITIDDILCAGVGIQYKFF